MLRFHNFYLTLTLHLRNGYITSRMMLYNCYIIIMIQLLKYYIKKRILYKFNNSYIIFIGNYYATIPQ